jgi:long-subunit fatty acid transport protein
MAGLAWDQTPVTERFRAVSLPDTDRYLAGLGARYRLTEAVTLEGAYQHSFAFSRASMNSSSNNNTDPFTHAVVLHGIYRVDVNLFALSARYKY